MKPVIFGLSGLSLTAHERAFFQDADPAGYILFKRNVQDRAQVAALTAELRALSGRDDLPILIDQEGGRVARMGPPEWPAFPAGPAFDALYDLAPMSAIVAARANGEALGATLAEVGITVDCAPLLDRRFAETTPAIAERAFGGDAMQVAALGRATLDGLEAAGVVGIIKHMPGHGRAVVDSHYELPVVTVERDTLEEDFASFRTLAKRATMGMTCHVIFTAVDPDRPATLSAKVIDDVIRGSIGFDGLLMTDDIDMKALTGSAGDKAAAALAAGCDIVLDCWARMDEMVEIAGKIGDITDPARARLDRAMASVARPGTSDIAAAIAKRDELLALA